MTLMHSREIDVEVEATAWTEVLPDVEALTRQAAVAAMGTDAGNLVILLTDDESVRDLNRRFRGKDGATNVLSFPASPNADGHLGDIALAFGVCEQEASDQAKPLADHLRHLVVHGVLHLLGHDHQDDDEAIAMESLEISRLAVLGVANPYGSEPRALPALEAVAGG